jgi:flavin reductase (DIM6/NTAB) family NADH-FMN oxidoreductase RutF
MITINNKTSMISIDKSLETAKLQAYLQGSVGPRPIAFASTVDENGNQIYLRLVFFNVFSANPPILVFRQQDGSR